MNQSSRNVLEEKSPNPFNLEPRMVSASRLAQNIRNCQYADIFRNNQLVAIPPADDKKLIKQKILKQWKLGEDVNAIDFWWDLKNHKTLERFIRHFNSQSHLNSISPDVFTYFNRLVAGYFPDTQFFLIPYFASECFRADVLTVPRTTTPFRSLPKKWGENCFRKPLKETTPPLVKIHPEAHMSTNPFVTEYIMSLFFSDFYTLKKSIHFVPVEDNSFSTCLTAAEQKETSLQTPPPINIKDLFVMKRVEGHSLYNIEDSWRPLPPNTEYQNACLIQVLHSIAMYQQEKISHNDLHGGNIMIEQMLPGTRWNNQQLINYDYFQYTIKNGEDLYIPFVPFVSKIIDFGLSCKYSKPQVFNKLIMKGLFSSATDLKGGDGQHRTLIPPNWFFPAYDVLMFLLNFCLMIFPKNLLAQQVLWMAMNFSRSENSLPSGNDAQEFFHNNNLKDVNCICGFNPDHVTNTLQIVLEDNIIHTYRNLDALSLLKKCMETTDILKPYTTKPSADKKCIVIGQMYK